MANTLGFYNPEFYAQEALIQLEQALGIAGRIYRGYDRERRSFGRGDTINISNPSTFVAQDAPGTAQDLNPDSTSLVLNKWKEVKFKLTDKELSFTTERIINDHIRPAAYALAQDIDSNLMGLYKDVPWIYDLNATPGSVITDVTGPHKVLFDNNVPINDPTVLHYTMNGTLQQGLLGLSAFAQQQGAGQVGVNTQLSGDLGIRYGMRFHATQTVKAHTSGTLSVTALALVGAHVAGDSTIDVDAVAVTGTVVAGDTLVIAGNTQRYAVTATATAAANALTISISPPLVAAYADNAVVTVNTDDSNAENLVFHRNAFALAMAPLSELGGQLGAKISTVTDPVTALSLRSRLFYDGNASTVYVALDVLYGYKTLDGNLAVRARD